MPDTNLRTRAERNDPRQWAATAGAPGGEGTPTVSAYTRRAYRSAPGEGPRHSTSYRGFRRNHARVIRKVAPAEAVRS